MNGRKFYHAKPSSKSEVTSTTSPTLSEIMDKLSPTQELNIAMSTSDQRHQTLKNVAPSTEGSTVVNNKKRRFVEISTPSDRLSLSGEDRGPDTAYVELRQKFGNTSLVVGRSQDPQQKKQKVAEDERLIYRKGYPYPPTYPKEASELEKMEGTRQEKFQNVKDAMLLEPLTHLDESDKRKVSTVANIIGISEQRRDPFMALSSAQKIEEASRPDSTETPKQVFGHKETKKKTTKAHNAPGSLSASGSNAKKHFKEVRAHLQDSTKALSIHGKSVLNHVKNTHMKLMRDGFNEKTMKRLAKEGMSKGFMTQAAITRMRSAATRTAAMMTGQIKYKLRTLTSKDKKD